MNLPYPLIVVLIIAGIIGLIVIIKRLRVGDGEEKKRRTDWNWIIPIGIISVLVGLGLIVPKYYKKDGKGNATVKSSALYSWKKLDHQYGYNPEQRFGGPFDAKITKNNAKNFSFIVYNRMGECYFDGWKIERTKKIEGRWRCPKTGDGGKWELQEDTRRPGMYTGITTDSYLPEGVPSELIIID